MNKDLKSQGSFLNKFEKREKQKVKYYEKEIQRIEDLSPSPLPQNRYKSPIKAKSDLQ